MGKGLPAKDPTGQSQIVQALVDALKANQPTPPPEPLPLPEFHGWDHEDPTKFLQECKLRLLASTPKQLWLPKISNKFYDHPSHGGKTRRSSPLNTTILKASLLKNTRALKLLHV